MLGSSKFNVAIVILVLFLLTLLAGGGFAYTISCRDRILYGVQTDGHSLFGMTQAEAEH